jgi:hypothetical protein
MKLPDDPQMSLSFRALGRGCRCPSRRSSGPRPDDRSRFRGSARHAIRPSPLSEPADADPDPGPHLRLGRLRHWPWRRSLLAGRWTGRAGLPRTIRRGTGQNLQTLRVPGTVSSSLNSRFCRTSRFSSLWMTLSDQRRSPTGGPSPARGGGGADERAGATSSGLGASAARGGQGAGRVGSAVIGRAGGGGTSAWSGSGGGRCEAIRNIYYRSDRQLPPGTILAPTPARPPRPAAWLKAIRHFG